MVAEVHATMHADDNYMSLPIYFTNCFLQKWATVIDGTLL
jgi:hypothetical protein